MLVYLSTGGINRKTTGSNNKLQRGHKGLLEDVGITGPEPVLQKPSLNPRGTTFIDLYKC